ncbi:DUF4238 domain-containing protein [Xanthobacter oligotrophicus]|uniref:DUF4238 domain-containing protein n=1 Tax=Xanthobacter oligotrophicus TaxID=2607286 RepID=A0ABW6ZVU8_9HYPH
MRQHVLPRASLNRFCGEHGQLELVDKALGKQRHARSDDHLFCAMRRWDQRAETGYMRGIEDDFQQLAEGIIRDDVKTLDETGRDIVQRFFALWGLRGHFKDEPSGNVRLNGTAAPGRQFSVDELERVEKLGATAIQPDGAVAGRHLTGLNIQMNIDRLAEEARSIPWGIAKSEDGQFLVSDRPFEMVVPVTPTIMLFGGNPSGIIELESLRDFNRRVMKNSQRFYFGQEITAAPV